MPRKRVESSSDIPEPMRPVLSQEARDIQMIDLAVKLAEKQLREGTASAQVITHFLKLGTVREQMELKKLEQETELAKAKIDAVKSNQRTEELYRDALEAFKSYSGGGNDAEI